MANSILAKMAVLITANTAELNKALQQSSNKLEQFQSSIIGAAKGLVAGFGAMKIAEFASDVSKLAGEADGVKRAFDRLPDSARLMNQLKDATAGTVSELQLMKRAVTATNFGIELAQLPKLLEFASVRAQQTGQSVDYLVDSIVTGIGRKSPLILDNLGISAVRLKEQFGGAALESQSIGDVAKAVGKIADEELTKMGGLVDTVALKSQRLTASWENLKVAIGKAANEVGVFDKTFNMLTNTLNALTGDKFTKGFNALLSGQKGAREELKKFADEGNKIDLTWQELLTRGFVRTEAAAKKYALILREIAGLQGESDTPLGPNAAPGMLGVDVMKEYISLQKQSNTETKAAITNAKDLFAIEEKAREARIKGLEEELAAKFKLQSYQGKIGTEGLTGFTSISPEALSSATAFAQAQGAIANAVSVANEKQKQQIDIIMMQREAWASVGAQMGDALAATIANAEGIAQVVKRLALNIISTLEQITLARMIADSSKYGIAGILAAAAGFGVVKGLFARIKSGGGSVNSGASRVGRTDMGSRVQFEIKGENLYGVLTNYQRNSRLTTTGG